MRSLSKVLVVWAVLVAGCAPDRDAAMSRFISRGTLARQGAENGDEISYWQTEAGGGSRLYKTQTPVTAPLLHRKPRALLPIPHR
jgi:hypothetical protein